MKSKTEIEERVNDLVERLLTLPNDCDDYVFDVPEAYLYALTWVLEEKDKLWIPSSYREKGYDQNERDDMNE